VHTFPWCNGNTTDFGSVIFGSSPDGKTKVLITAGVYPGLLTNTIDLSGGKNFFMVLVA
jgi:hypothetical protein